ncbi:hypothetical protein TNCV_1448011 [Trichonephila clavipes]|nr:hypothetical protein TNCV_1448011 [Trichonephila clavipes]
MKFTPEGLRPSGKEIPKKEDLEDQIMKCKGNAESHLGCVWGHSCSTDDEPMHWFCPHKSNTWCKYNAAINNNLQNYKHKPSVAKAIRDVIKPVFADLSHPALPEEMFRSLIVSVLFHLAAPAREDCFWTLAAMTTTASPDCTLSAAVRPFFPFSSRPEENLKHTKRRNRQGLYDKYIEI